MFLLVFSRNFRAGFPFSGGEPAPWPRRRPGSRPPARPGSSAGSVDPLVLSDDDSVEAKRRCLGLGTSDDPLKFSDDESDESVAAPAPPPSPSEQQQVWKWLDAPRLIASSQSAACSLDISGQSATFAHLVAHGAEDHGKTRYVIHNLQTALHALAASGLAEQDPDVPVETTVETIGVMHCQGEGAINDRCPRWRLGGVSVAVALNLLGCTPDVLSSGFVIPDLDAFDRTLRVGRRRRHAAEAVEERVAAFFLEHS